MALAEHRALAIQRLRTAREKVNTLKLRFQGMNDLDTAGHCMRVRDQVGKIADEFEDWARLSKTEGDLDQEAIEMAAKQYAKDLVEEHAALAEAHNMLQADYHLLREECETLRKIVASGASHDDHAD